MTISININIVCHRCHIQHDGHFILKSTSVTLMMRWWYLRSSTRSRASNCHFPSPNCFKSSLSNRDQTYDMMWWNYQYDNVHHGLPANSHPPYSHQFICSWGGLWLKSLSRFRFLWMNEWIYRCNFPPRNQLMSLGKSRGYMYTSSIIHNISSYFDFGVHEWVNW